MTLNKHWHYYGYEGMIVDEEVIKTLFNLRIHTILSNVLQGLIGR